MDITGIISLIFSIAAWVVIGYCSWRSIKIQNEFKRSTAKFDKYSKELREMCAEMRIKRAELSQQVTAFNLHINPDRMPQEGRIDIPQERLNAWKN